MIIGTPMQCERQRAKGSAAAVCRNFGKAHAKAKRLPLSKSAPSVAIGPQGSAGAVEPRIGVSEELKNDTRVPGTGTVQLQGCTSQRRRQHGNEFSCLRIADRAGRHAKIVTRGGVHAEQPGSKLRHVKINFKLAMARPEQGDRPGQPGLQHLPPQITIWPKKKRPGGLHGDRTGAGWATAGPPHTKLGADRYRIEPKTVLAEIQVFPGDGRSRQACRHRRERTPPPLHKHAFTSPYHHQGSGGRVHDAYYCSRNNGQQQNQGA
jgi:hypothetical protein